MTQIAETDAAIIRLLDSCAFPGVNIESSPHSWDDGYLQRLLGALPAIRVAFTGADPYDDTATSTVLDMVGTWEAYICTGWNGTSQEERRKGAGAGFDLLHRAAAALHTAILKDEVGNRLPQVVVDGIEIVSDSALDISNLWVAGIRLKVELPLELVEGDACYGPLDEWLKTAATFDLPGVGHEFDPDAGDEIGEDGDVTTQIDMPQTE